MARIVGYMGVSLDGFIAGPNESLDWLYKHGGVDYGEYDHRRFIKGIGTLVWGRATYDWVRREVPGKWDYADHDSIVVTSHPLPDPPPRVAAWPGGVDALISHLRDQEGQDVWIVGGGKLQSAFIDRHALDYLELYVVPYLVGEGIRLWPGSKVPQRLELDDVRHIERGVVRLAYRLNATQ